MPGRPSEARPRTRSRPRRTGCRRSGTQSGRVPLRRAYPAIGPAPARRCPGCALPQPARDALGSPHHGVKPCPRQATKSHHHLRRHRAIHTRTMSPTCRSSPTRSPSRDRAAEAGAAIISISRARFPRRGQAGLIRSAFGRFLRTSAAVELRHQPDVRRLAADAVGDGCNRRRCSRPEVASLNMGSDHVALYPMLNATGSSRWGSVSRMHADLWCSHAFQDIEYVAETCYGNDTRSRFECDDIGHLYNLQHSSIATGERPVRAERYSDPRWARHPPRRLMRLRTRPLLGRENSRLSGSRRRSNGRLRDVARCVNVLAP